MSEPRKKDLIEDRVRFQHGYVMGLAHRSDRKITDDDRRILERVAASLMRLWEIENAPDRFCVTQPDGACVSTDPRCMHHEGVGPGAESDR